MRNKSICNSIFRNTVAIRWGEKEAAVLLGFGFVFAQSQAAVGMLLRSSLAKPQNSSLPNGYSISSNVLDDIAQAPGKFCRLHRQGLAVKKRLPAARKNFYRDKKKIYSVPPENNFSGDGGSHPGGAGRICQRTVPDGGRSTAVAF